MPFLNQPLSRPHTWLVTLASAGGGAWVNHTLSAGNNGRLTFMLLYPAVLLGGYLGGAGPAIVAGLIGAAALATWHPEMADGRTLGELGSVGLFLLICALIARVCDSLHRAETFARNGKASGPAIAEIPLRGPFAPLVVWPVSLLALGVAVAVNPEIAAYSGGRLPFVVLLPVMALAGYMGGFVPAFLTTAMGVASVWIWHRHVGGITGGPFYILSGMYIFIGSVIGLLAEALVRERRRSAAGAAALRELPEAQARLAAIAQTSPDALWIWDVNAQRFVFMSPASKQLTGLTAAEACEQTQDEFWTHIHPEDRHSVEAAMHTLKSAETKQTLEYEYRHLQPDGSWRWLRNRAGVFTRTPDGDVAQIFGHTEDITDRRDATERLASQAVELARTALEREATLRERENLLEAERVARAEAERANRLKDDFLATVSHELRTPLTAMLGWTAMLTEETEDSELLNGLEVISRNARAQRQLIEDLLDMSRIMSGKLRIEPRPLMIGNVVSPALESVQPAAEARGVTLLSNVQQCEEPIHADMDRLQQIIWNLLSNAVKFTPSGGQVRIEARCTSSEVTISVADTGQGMAPEFVPHVFERFRQEDAATTRKTGGLGLGLAIVKHLVELHGGTVRACSEGIGQGSEFSFTLPLKSSRVSSLFGRMNTSSTLTSARPVESDYGFLTGRRILIIDDEADTRGFLRRVLAERGAQVTLADSAEEGLRHTLQEKPDAVICDVSMPIEDGYSFIRRLRRAEDGSQIPTPAAALTALARLEDKQRALEAGFDEHHAKPIEPAELLSLVERLLRAN